MNLSDKFHSHFKQHFASLFNTDTKCIVAVSGGVDSIVLVDLLHKIGVDFLMAHCNFNLRGDESKRDEDFVKTLAATYSKELLVKQFDTANYAAEHKLSIQIAARKLRYEWFADIQYSKNNQVVPNSQFPIPNCYLLTAHHKNDNIETVLFNFFRGTGIQGLTGIKPIDADRKILRPLLVFSKEEIKNYAAENRIAFVEDISNASNKYTRNSFRNEIIPMVTKHFANAEENIFNNINKMNDVEELYHQAIAIHKKNLLEHKGNEVHIPILKLKKLTPLYSIVYEVINDYGFAATQTNEIIKLLDARNGSYVQSASHRIINNRNWLIVTPIKETPSGNIIINKEDTIVAFDDYALRITNDELNKNQYQSTKAEIASERLDLSKLEFPLLLRKWKQGDYFYPLGMKKKQKLSKFFINQKLSITQKEKVWVMESNKKIVWVVGYRIDDRFKLTDSTKNVLKISLLNTVAPVL